MIDVGAIKLCTFDCYGTLVDWERGLLAGVRPVLERHGASPGDAEIIEVFAREERDIESGSYMSYRDVCAENMRRMAGLFGVALDAGEEHALAESIADWPAFAETPGCLGALKRRFGIGILSNIDDDLFEATSPCLGVELDHLVTAQQVRSYKPGPAHFTDILSRSGLEPRQVLHIAESRFHDVAPAKPMGFPTVWVNRSGGGASASGQSDATPDLEVGSLSELVDRLTAAG